MPSIAALDRRSTAAQRGRPRAAVSGTTNTIITTGTRPVRPVVFA